MKVICERLHRYMQRSFNPCELPLGCSSTVEQHYELAAISTTAILPWSDLPVGVEWVSVRQAGRCKIGSVFAHWIGRRNPICCAYDATSVKWRHPLQRVHLLTPRVVKNLRIFFVAVPCIISLVGVFFVVMGTREWMYARESVSWSSVPGRVLTSRVSRSTHHNKGSTSHSHTPQVEYQYSVGGATFTSSKVSFQVRGEGASGAQAIVDKYPPNSPVEVFYDPTDSSRSVLEPGDGWANLIPPAVGLFAIAFCGFFIWAALKITRQMLPKPPALAAADPREALPSYFRDGKGD